MKGLRWLLALPLFAVSSAAFALDARDLAIHVRSGVSWSTPRRFQGGASIGYGVADEFSLGLGFDAIGTRTQEVVAELRWSLEPIEIRGTVGGRRVSFEKGGSDTNPIVSLGASYLMSLTSSLAAGADMNFVIPLSGDGDVVLFTGLGGRILF